MRGVDLVQSLQGLVVLLVAVEDDQRSTVDARALAIALGSVEKRRRHVHHVEATIVLETSG